MQRLPARDVEPLEKQLASLTALKRARLAELWRELYSADPPAKISDLLMRQAIGYRLQVKHLGGLDFSTRRALELARRKESDQGDADIKPQVRPARRRAYSP